MKGIKKTFMAGVLACATFNVHAEVNPFGYGIKGGIGTSAAIRYNDEAKIGGKKAQNDFLGTLAFFSNLYGEYAVMDYIGFGLGVGYMRQGGSLKGSEDDASAVTPSSISITSHGIIVPFYLCIYPFGREEEEGIFKVTVGASGYISLQPIYKKDNQALSLTDNEKNQAQRYDVALTGGMEYELPLGISFEAKYRHGLMNRFKTENPSQTQTMLTSSNASVTELKKLYMHNATIGVGYNLASLWSE